MDSLRKNWTWDQLLERIETALRQPSSVIQIHRQPCQVKKQQNVPKCTYLGEVTVVGRAAPLRA